MKLQDMKNLDSNGTNHNMVETKKDNKMEGRNSMKTDTQAISLEEAYEMLENQLESLRPLKWYFNCTEVLYCFHHAFW